MSLVLRYGLFALVATLVNIGIQDTVVRFYMGDFSVSYSIFAGTGMGLLVKYILDKKYIFCFEAQDLSQDSATFLLYALMGLVTTGFFWGLELLFDAIFQAKEMRYLGGIIGLSIGYVIKYHLDKRYVFSRSYEEEK